MFFRIFKFIGFGQFKNIVVYEKCLLLKYKLWRGLFYRNYFNNSFLYIKFLNFF